jgi:8-oxo-dGTP pyrophosphatase MutT (NUDIX family)
MIDLGKLSGIIQKTSEEQIITSQQQLALYPEQIATPLLFTNPATKESAVAVILHTNQKEKTPLCFSMIRRPTYNGVHSGQMAFPGGKKELSDKNLIATAIRETKEEIGIELSEDNLIYTLRPVYVPPSNFIIYPFLFINPSPKSYQLDTREVAELIEITVNELTKTEISLEKIDLEQDKSLKVHAYRLSQNSVWGASAVILAELKVYLKELNF